MRDDEKKSRPRAKALRREMTKAELLVWSRLRDLNTRGFKFRRQHPVGPYIADFAHVKGKLLVEIDGITHSTAERAAHDEQRDNYLRAKRWKVIRIADTFVYENAAEVVEYIVRSLPPHPHQQNPST